MGWRFHIGTKGKSISVASSEIAERLVSMEPEMR